MGGMCQTQRFDQAPAALPPDLALLNDVVSHVARRYRLRRPDAEDFAQSTLLRALGGEWRVFEKFDGRSSLRTYLTAAVTHLLLDSRNRTLGRWRPSAAALRLGRPAVLLEQLIHKDGFTRGEAVAMVHEATGEHEALLMHVVEQLPARVRRRVVSNAELLDSLPAAMARKPLVAADERRRSRIVRGRLVRAVASLPPHVQSLLSDRYARNLSVRAIATERNVEPKRLYRQYERVLAALKRRLQADGVSGM
jgi:RNA polymerase sigma factor (sigma-70 family)